MCSPWRSCSEYSMYAPVGVKSILRVSTMPTTLIRGASGGSSAFQRTDERAGTLSGALEPAVSGRLACRPMKLNMLKEGAMRAHGHVLGVNIGACRL
eukprot:4655612-Prymnesium_polylepis.1